MEKQLVGIQSSQLLLWDIASETPVFSTQTHIKLYKTVSTTPV